MATAPSSRGRNIFPFLELPAELRNRVYDEALFHDGANGCLAAVSLLRVCRQVYIEAKEIRFEDSDSSMDVKTPQTLWWSPDMIGKPLREMGLFLGTPETTFTLGISGDFEGYLHGSRRQGHYDRFPSVGDIYDLLPQILLRFHRINVSLEVICVDTTTHFLYALACFLNTTDAKTEELYICVTKGNKFRARSDDLIRMWYSLVKMPARLCIYIIGDLEKDEDVHGLRWVEAYVRGKFLLNNKPNPSRLASTTFNTVKEYRRISLMARPLLDTASEETVDGAHTSRISSELSWKLRNIEREIESEGVSRNLPQYRDAEQQNDLEMCEDWALGRASAQVYGWPQERELQHVYRQKLKVAHGEVDQWDKGLEYEELRHRL
ncbi:hypothetical protein CLAFUR0_09570 [Fulvia fulva]|nr:hypothetical protein CLAFUR0_09570 [Fulvia fulva]